MVDFETVIYFNLFWKVITLEVHFKTMNGSQMMLTLNICLWKVLEKRSRQILRLIFNIEMRQCFIFLLICFPILQPTFLCAV